MLFFRILLLLTCLLPASLWAQISGTFTAGNLNDDFSSVQHAINYLSNSGTNGSVTILISPGNHGSIAISGLNPGINDTITFASASALVSDVTFDNCSIDNSENIVFKGISFLQIQQFNLTPVISISQSRKIYFLQCNIMDGYTNQANWGNYAPIHILCNGGGFRQVYFDSCILYSLDGSLSNGANKRTIYSTGNFGRFYFNNCTIVGSLEFDDNNGKREFLNCQMNIDEGFRFADIDSCNIIFFPDENGNPRHINLRAEIKNSTVSGPSKLALTGVKVDNSFFDCELDVSASSQCEFKNSEVTGDFRYNIPSSTVGITYNAIIESNTFHEKARIFGMFAPTFIADNFFLGDLQLGTVGSTYHVLNNNFAANTTLQASGGSGFMGVLQNNNLYDLAISGIGSSNLIVSNNNYFSGSSTSIMHASFDDSPSFIDPQYVSLTDLHIQNPALYAAGDSLDHYFLDEDRDNDIRETHPTLGADETCLSTPLPDTIELICGEFYALKYCDGTPLGFTWQNAQNGTLLQNGALVQADSVRKYYLLDATTAIVDSLIISQYLPPSTYRELWGYCTFEYSIASIQYPNYSISWSPANAVSDSLASIPTFTSDTSLLLIATNDLGICGSYQDSIYFHIIRQAQALIYVDSSACLGYNFLSNALCYDSIQWEFSDGTTYLNQEAVWHEFQSGGTYQVIVNVWLDSVLATDTVEYLFSCVGLEEVEAPSVHLFPNPSSDLIHVSISETLIGADYVICDLLGRKVDTGKLTSIQSTINVQKLSPGVHLLLLQGKSYRFEIVRN